MVKLDQFFRVNVLDVDQVVHDRVNGYIKIFYIRFLINDHPGELIMPGNKKKLCWLAFISGLTVRKFRQHVGHLVDPFLQFFIDHHFYHDAHVSM